MAKKSIRIQVEKPFLDALDEHRKRIESNRSKYIVEAIKQRVEREGGSLPAAAAPNGVRADARPNGWRSRLYQDRYQLVATFIGGDWVINHLHDVDVDTITQTERGTIRANEPYPLDVTIFAPEHFARDVIQEELHLEMFSIEVAHLFDRDIREEE